MNATRATPHRSELSRKWSRGRSPPPRGSDAYPVRKIHGDWWTDSLNDDSERDATVRGSTPETEKRRGNKKERGKFESQGLRADLEPARDASPGSRDSSVAPPKTSGKVTKRSSASRDSSVAPPKTSRKVTKRSSASRDSSSAKTKTSCKVKKRFALRGQKTKREDKKTPASLGGSASDRASSEEQACYVASPVDNPWAGKLDEEESDDEGWLDEDAEEELPGPADCCEESATSEAEAGSVHPVSPEQQVAIAEYEEAPVLRSRSEKRRRDKERVASPVAPAKRRTSPADEERLTSPAASRKRRGTPADEECVEVHDKEEGEGKEQEGEEEEEHAGDGEAEEDDRSIHSPDNCAAFDPYLDGTKSTIFTVLKCLNDSQGVVEPSKSPVREQASQAAIAAAAALTDPYGGIGSASGPAEALAKAAKGLAEAALMLPAEAAAKAKQEPSAAKRLRITKHRKTTSDKACIVAPQSPGKLKNSEREAAAAAVKRYLRMTASAKAAAAGKPKHQPSSMEDVVMLYTRTRQFVRLKGLVELSNFNGIDAEVMYDHGDGFLDVMLLNCMPGCVLAMVKASFYDKIPCPGK